MNKFCCLVVSFILFSCIFVQAQEYLQPSQGIKLPDTSSVSSDTTQKSVSESVLADTTIIVPLLDFKEVEIRDILNSLAKAYKLNLWLDPSIVGKTTVYFEKVPLNNILEFIIKENNLEYERTGDIIKLRAKKVIIAPIPQKIEYKDNLLSVDLKGMELDEVVRGLVKETKKNIVVEKGVSGKITGLLERIDFDKGLNALMSTNGFSVNKAENIYYIDKLEQTKGEKVRGGYSVTYNSGMLSLDVTNADLGQLLNEISNHANLDFFVYGDIQGRVSAQCKDLEVEDALRYLFKGTDYTFRKEKEIYFIGNKNMEGVTQTEFIPLKHLVADGVLELIPKELSSKATLKVVKEQNGIIAIGPYGTISDIKDFIEKIDHPPAQILIEALVVDYSKTDYREFGITANNYGLSSPENLKENYYPDVDVYTHGEEINKNIDKYSSQWKVNNIGHLSADFFVKLHALEQEGKANIRSRPQIATLNGHKAKIDVGTTQYYLLKTETTYAGNQPTTATQISQRFETIEASMSLSITPWVTSSQEIIVEIHPEFNTPQGSFDPNVPPTINHRILDSTVRLRDGETIVLGGLVQSLENQTIKKFPILGNIPIIGRIFQNRTTTKTNAELVIYLTPHIYYGGEGAVDVTGYEQK
ncbi:MAG TPA: secretin and TonB N-terminal domain-containing protein [candidate division Zixibacteria bacterium]